jgi:thiol-disulfide isomerase/thioredoxin
MTTRTMAVPLGAILVVALCTLTGLDLRPWTKPGIDKPGDTAQHPYPIAPKFRLTDITGKPLNLSDYQGKVVLLDFWATWCAPCRWEVPDLVELQGKYRASGLRVIGISLDDEAGPIRKFYREFDMNYPVAMGGDPVSDLFGGIPGLPTTFLIGRDGRIHDKHVGARGMEFFEPKVRELLKTNAEVLPPLTGSRATARSVDMCQPHAGESESASMPANCQCGCAKTHKRCRGTGAMCDPPTQAAMCDPEGQAAK